MERLLRKGDTAKTLGPAPVLHQGDVPARCGAIYFGSTSAAMDEAMANFAARGVALDTLRLRAFPFPASVNQFIAEHEHVFVVEQNRDGQMRSLLINELGIEIGRAHV